MSVKPAMFQLTAIKCTVEKFDGGLETKMSEVEEKA
jgi:hypothetical protein